jgi:MFS family permease
MLIFEQCHVCLPLVAGWYCRAGRYQWRWIPNSWPHLKWCYCWHNLFPSSCLPCRDSPSGERVLPQWFSWQASTDICQDKRGRIIIIQQLAIEWGILIMYFVSYGCTKIPGTASFRTAWGIQFIPCVLLMIGLPFLPRSPRWLAKVGRDQEAIQTLADIQARGNVDDPLVIAEWEEISTVLRAERESVRGWRKFTANGMWKRTLAGMSVQAWQVSVVWNQPKLKD